MARCMSLSRDARLVENMQCRQESSSIDFRQPLQSKQWDATYVEARYLGFDWRFSCNHTSPFAQRPKLTSKQQLRQNPCSNARACHRPLDWTKNDTNRKYNCLTIAPKKSCLRRVLSASSCPMDRQSHTQECKNARNKNTERAHTWAIASSGFWAAAKNRARMRWQLSNSMLMWPENTKIALKANWILRTYLLSFL